MNDRFKFRVWRQENPFVENWQPKYVYLTLGSESGFCKTDIIEQCTGLKDKNRKLIYEGDIVREISKKEPEWEEYVTEVKWKVCGFNIYDTADFYFEVIGNIHENKELLDEQ